MTVILQPDDTGLAQAAAFLRAGELVAFGTETVYGLGGDATNGNAMAAIFTAKGRPHFNPLICHYPNATLAFAHVAADARARRLADTFWPGPLTLVLPRLPGCPVHLLAGAGLDTLAVRVPDHPMARVLLERAGTPIAAPSANRSGGVSPTSAAHVMHDLAGRIAAVLDSGTCAVGLESTVLDLTGGPPVLLRPGGIAIEAIEAAIGTVATALAFERAGASRTLRSPGMLISHYAPSLPVRLHADEALQNEALLAFGPVRTAVGLKFNLSPAANLAEAAARLFQGLRWLDAEGSAAGLTGIAAMRVPDHGLGVAINDRLRRAAAPRS